MSLRRETLPSTSSLDRSPLPGSHKVYVPGPGGMRVPFREIGLSPTRGLRGETEMNPPFRVYDTSGPYTDPAVPIDLEAGLPELQATVWNGIFVPAGTPRPVIEALHRELVRAYTAPDVRDQLRAGGSYAAADTPEEFAAFVRSEKERWGKLGRESGIKPQ